METNKWGGEFDKCIECGTTERKHHGYGLCINCYSRKNRRDNLEKMREKNKIYEARPEIKAKRKEYNQSDRRKESVNKSAAKFREKNKELCLERTRVWRSENPDKLKEYDLARRDVEWVQKYGEDALRLIMENDYSCQKCGSKNRLAIHHIDWKPENNVYNNFSVLCNKCHSRVHMWSPLRLRKSIFDEWMVTPLEELDTDGRRRGAVRNLVS